MRKIEKLAEEYMQKKYGTKMVIMPEESSIYEAKKKGYQDGIRKGIELAQAELNGMDCDEAKGAIQYLQAWIEMPEGKK